MAESPNLLFSRWRARRRRSQHISFDANDRAIARMLGCDVRQVRALCSPKARPGARLRAAVKRACGITWPVVESRQLKLGRAA